MILGFFNFLSHAIVVTSIMILSAILISLVSDSVSAQVPLKPTLHDSDLSTETIATGLKFPVGMAFLGKDDILVLEKDNGTVIRIKDGIVRPQPLLDLPVSNGIGRGAFGIAISKNNDNQTYVFISFLESRSGKDENEIDNGIRPLGNRLYRFEWINDKLINPGLLIDTAPWPGPFHYGGKVIVGYDKNLYYVTGDLGPRELHLTQAENIRDGNPPDGTAGILVLAQNGSATTKGMFGSVEPSSEIKHPFFIWSMLTPEILDPRVFYYGYGIRNSFGIGFDPVSSKLWETENGPGNADEINLVEPGFNSGWNVTMGMAFKTFDPALSMDVKGNSTGQNILPSRISEDLVTFGGKGMYSDPEFVWEVPVAVTDLAFLNSTILGPQYENDMFVGDFNGGRLYDFDLNENRTSLIVGGALEDKVASGASELCESKNETACIKYNDIVFGEGFGGITDLEVGPDGHLYVLSHLNGEIYRIVSKDFSLIRGSGQMSFT